MWELIKYLKDEIYAIKTCEEKIEREALKYKAKTYTCDFQQYETIRSFRDNIYTVKINIDEADMYQSNLLKNLVEFNN